MSLKLRTGIQKKSQTRRLSQYNYTENLWPEHVMFPHTVSVLVSIFEVLLMSADCMQVYICVLWKGVMADNFDC